jgi:hypothetical protein
MSIIQIPRESLGKEDPDPLNKFKHQNKSAFVHASFKYEPEIEICEGEEHKLYNLDTKLLRMKKSELHYTYMKKSLYSGEEIVTKIYNCELRKNIDGILYLDVIIN